MCLGSYNLWLRPFRYLFTIQARCAFAGVMMPFAHVSIRTSDMERSIRFYEGYFGMKLANRREIPKNDAEIAFLENDGAPFRLELTFYRKQKRFEQAEYES